MSETMDSDRITILLVDDHELVREGLRLVLQRNPNLTIVGEAGTGLEALAAAARLNPDIIIMDLLLPILSGLDASQRILRQAPDSRIIILSACDSREHVARAIRIGALGYVIKRSAAKELLRAVETVWRRQLYLSPDAAAGVPSDIDDYAASPLEQLSAREREVLYLTVSGATSANIAQLLSLSQKTVETYRSRVMRKLCVRNRTELIRFAINHAIAPS